LIQDAGAGFVPAIEHPQESAHAEGANCAATGTSNSSARSVSFNQEEETEMNLRPIIIASTLVFATSAFAEGVSKKTPGHQMQGATTSTGPGASQNAPGHKMKSAKKSGSFTGPGASDYAPGQQTTGSATKKRY
jgi:hypothetical protein